MFSGFTFGIICPEIINHRPYPALPYTPKLILTQFGSYYKTDDQYKG